MGCTKIVGNERWLVDQGLQTFLLKRVESPKSFENRKRFLVSAWIQAHLRIPPRPFRTFNTNVFNTSPGDTEKTCKDIHFAHS